MERLYSPIREARFSPHGMVKKIRAGNMAAIHPAYWLGLVKVPQARGKESQRRPGVRISGQEICRIPREPSATANRTSKRRYQTGHRLDSTPDAKRVSQKRVRPATIANHSRGRLEWNRCRARSKTAQLAVSTLTAKPTFSANLMSPTCHSQNPRNTNIKAAMVKKATFNGNRTDRGRIKVDARNIPNIHVHRSRKGGLNVAGIIFTKSSTLKHVVFLIIHDPDEREGERLRR